MKHTGPDFVDRITDKFGGQTALAELIDVDQSTISHWKRRGEIPARQQRRILEVGRRKGVDISPADFFDVPPIRVRKSRAA